MDQKQFNEIKARVAKATPGPWVIEESRFGSFNAASVDENYDLPACLMKANDADFVTNAREDVPALLVEVERLQKSITWYDHEHSRLHNIGAETALENEQLREALEFYANENSHFRVDLYAESTVMQDKGEIARQALGGESDD